MSLLDSMVPAMSVLDAPAPMRRYAPEPAVDESSPIWREPVVELCKWCGQKPHACQCSRGFGE